MRIICVDRKINTFNTIVGLVMNTDGDSISERTVVTNPNALEHNWSRVTPWDDFKVDEPVMVREDTKAPWQKRHFAGVGKDGQPMAWADGRTSFTTEEMPMRWHDCRWPTEEEMGHELA